MANGLHFLNLKNRHDKVQFAFVVLGGALSMVLTAASPFLTYLLFTGIVASLTYSYSYWENLAKIGQSRPSEAPAPLPETGNNPAQRQEEAITGDMITKVVGATAITLIGLYYSLYFVAMSQLIVGTFVGCVLSWFFIDQCVISSQQALNQALKKAVGQSNPQHVRQLMQRGADPYARDKQGNSAFHYAIQNHAHAAMIISLLKSKDNQQRITFKQVLASLKGFFNQDIKHKIGEVLTPFKTLFRENTQDNRLTFYQALGHLANAFYDASATLINRLVKYLRQEIASTKNIHKPNRAKLRPVDLIETKKIAKKYRKGILTAFANSKKPTSKRIRSMKTRSHASPSRLYPARH